jgi:hypothetical protein
MTTETATGKTNASTETDSALSTGELTPSDADYRLVKWQLLRTAQALLPHERVAFCMRRVQATTVDVLYSPHHQSAHYGGLMVCGSIWVCPLCAAKFLSAAGLR